MSTISTGSSVSGVDAGVPAVGVAVEHAARMSEATRAIIVGLDRFESFANMALRSCCSEGRAERASYAGITRDRFKRSEAVAASLSARYTELP